MLAARRPRGRVHRAAVNPVPWARRWMPTRSPARAARPSARPTRTRRRQGPHAVPAGGAGRVTGGRSLEANLALLEDNARVAGEVAVARDRSLVKPRAGASHGAASWGPSASWRGVRARGPPPDDLIRAQGWASWPSSMALGGPPGLCRSARSSGSRRCYGLRARRAAAGARLTVLRSGTSLDRRRRRAARVPDRRAGRGDVLARLAPPRGRDLVTVATLVAAAA